MAVMEILSVLLFIGGLGPTEWVLIILAILLLFGGKKIPELMKGLGQGIKEFNKAKNEVQDKLNEGMKDESKDA